MSFDDEEDLLSRIDTIYMNLDTDGSGGLTFDEFRANVKLLPGGAKIRYACMYPCVCICTCLYVCMHVCRDIHIYINYEI